MKGKQAETVTNDLNGVNVVKRDGRAQQDYVAGHGKMYQVENELTSIAKRIDVKDRRSRWPSRETIISLSLSARSSRERSRLRKRSLTSTLSVDEVSLMSKTVVQNWIGHTPEARRGWLDIDSATMG